jgi:hypothetical protein
MNDYSLNDMIVDALLIDVNDRFCIFKYLISSVKTDCEALLAISADIKIACLISNLFIMLIIADLSLRFI